MFHIKTNRLICTIVLLSFGLMTLLSGCNGTPNVTSDSSKQKLIEDISEALVLSGSNKNYETYTVTTTDITSSISYTATANFPHSEEILFPYKDGKIIFLHDYSSHHIGGVGSCDYFEEGEPIASFLLHLDPLKAQELQIELEKTEKLYQANSTIKKDHLESLKHSLDNAESAETRLFYEHEYEAALNEYNEYVTSQEELIKSLRESCDFYSQEATEIYIYAPRSGLILLRDSSMGELYEYGDLVGTFYSLDDITLNVKIPTYIYNGEKAPVFNLGDKISFTSSSIIYGYDFTGTVISAPNTLYSASMSYVTVSIDDFENTISTMEASYFIDDFHVEGTYIIAEDALVIPPSAIEIILDPLGEPTMTGTVTMYNNGNIYKTIVTYAYQDSEYFWITSGLNEGDVIVLN